MAVVGSRLAAKRGRGDVDRAGAAKRSGDDVADVGQDGEDVAGADLLAAAASSRGWLVLTVITYPAPAWCSSLAVSWWAFRVKAIPAGSCPWARPPPRRGSGSAPSPRLGQGGSAWTRR